MLKYKNTKPNINGWIFVDKPIGLSSNSVLQIIRKLFKGCKAGYVGTLDPLATGFLPVALGKATKTIKYLEKADKEYIFTVHWGIKTLSGDLEGLITEKKAIFPTQQLIEKKIESYLGYKEQTPPRFSAIKINGIRSYKIAREGKKFQPPKRKIIIS